MDRIIMFSACIFTAFYGVWNKCLAFPLLALGHMWLASSVQIVGEDEAVDQAGWTE